MQSTIIFDHVTGLIRAQKTLAIQIPARSAGLDVTNFTDSVKLVPRHFDIESWIQKECQIYMSNTNIYRSKIHAKWAEFFDLMHIPFQYISDPVEVGAEVSYLPEFWLPEQDSWMIIRKHRFNCNEERLMALGLSRYTQKTVVAFYDCKQGIEDESPVDSQSGGLDDCHKGQYLTPEGERDGLIEIGICDQCGKVSIGDSGLHERCYKHKTNPPNENQRLVDAFNFVNKG